MKANIYDGLIEVRFNPTNKTYEVWDLRGNILVSTETSMSKAHQSAKARFNITMRGVFALLGAK